MGSEPAKPNAGEVIAGSGWYQALAPVSQRLLATDAARRGAMQRHVADVVALEQHIEQALAWQVEHIREPAPAAAAVRRFHAVVRGQRLALQARLERLGGDPAGPVDSPAGPAAGSASSGAVAGRGLRSRRARA